MENYKPLITDGVTDWPQTLKAQYRARHYWGTRTLASYIEEQVGQHPDRLAVVDNAIRLSYQQLWDRSASCAQFLLDRSIRRGDRIIVQLPNTWEFVVFTLACFRIGVIPVMAMPAHRQHELSHVARLSGAVAIAVPEEDRGTDLRSIAHEVAQQIPSIHSLFVSGKGTSPEGVSPHSDTGNRVREYRLINSIGVQPRFDEAAYSPDARDVALMLLSGGTTGAPKLIVRTHMDYAYNIQKCSEVGGFSAQTVYMVALPASHNFPLGSPGYLGALFHGGRTVLLRSPEAVRALTTIDQESVTVTAVVPAVAHKWIEVQREQHVMKGNSLQVLQVGGSRMPDKLAPAVRQVLGATLQQVFGMAEGLINMTRLDDSEDVCCNTQGRPVSDGDEIRVVDENGHAVPDGTLGLLITRGPYTPCGYFKAPEANARSFNADGWYRTGDIVMLRPDGNLVVSGRDKDMINRGGENISAEEVESFVYQFSQVMGAAAIAMPDKLLGERLCLYVTLKPNTHFDLDALKAYMEKIGVAKFKIPEKLVIVEELPMTKIGKIDKKWLRSDVVKRLAADAAPAH
ncbi:MAG: (2,3-dihydroxybenzoyl)adenylate synthase [Castellaniella sp.]|uniref:(2,3-dihydroxybenzoyl)adenylate synthase n=1 Tax=Castellaniella sp. TaxID=1955812 RepID=UPI00122A242F|nr:AMP-binding protein [Castellaniella sp.]TAN27114.1 MAG: (2,3-dihydroxybenzoyl)adenylate synthase [Castellaniella sp.]